MQFRILGPLEVLDDDSRPLALGGPKQRALLAVLLLEAGTVVSAERLIDELWGEDPPERARSVLQVYVANLRKVLQPARPRRTASSVLKTKPPGYLLDLDAHAFDLASFEALASEGQAALAAGDTQTAAIALRRALELWRGPVLGDVAAELADQGVLAGLEEQRLAALEQRLEADLMLGRHLELVGELEALVTAHPLRERLRGQLMVALYRCGRQAEALDIYRQTRETLAEELGLGARQPVQEAVGALGVGGLLAVDEQGRHGDLRRRADRVEGQPLGPRQHREAVAPLGDAAPVRVEEKADHARDRLRSPPTTIWADRVDLQRGPAPVRGLDRRARR